MGLLSMGLSSIIIILSLVIGSVLIRTVRTMSTDKQSDSGRQSSGFGDTSRKKRATSILALIGEAAVNFLLNGARPIWARSKFHKRYEKQGDFKSALKDFYSVGPRDVHIELVKKGIGKGVSKVTGQVGDKKLTLVKKSREKFNPPVLDIQPTSELPAIASSGDVHLFTTQGKPYERIIYRTKLKE